MKDPRAHVDRALLKRIALTQRDFAEASQFVQALLDLDGGDCPGARDVVYRDALTTATIVAYGRPFSGNRATPDVVGFLPSTFIEAMNTEQRWLHDRIIDLRNTEFAHSDPEPPSVGIVAAPSSDGGVGIQVWHTPVRQTLSRSDLELLRDLLSQLVSMTGVELVRIQATLIVGEHF